MEIIAIKDRIQDTYNPPMFVPNIAGAIRGMADMVNNKKEENFLQQHPDDYELWHMGKFDELCANKTWEIFDKPILIATGTNLKL